MKLERWGFNAAITHVFHGGIEYYPRYTSMDLIGVACMSHKESILLEEHYDLLLDMVRKANYKGLIIGATKPTAIRTARKLFGKEITIFSPGVGTQGASFGSAIINGSDFEIIGRSIIYNDDPPAIVRKIVEAERDAAGRNS